MAKAPPTINPWPAASAVTVLKAALKRSRNGTFSHNTETNYRKFGFKNMPGLVHEGVPPEVFFALSFDGHIPHGTVTFHETFNGDGRQRVQATLESAPGPRR